jgi:hypothetical protein
VTVVSDPPSGAWENRGRRAISTRTGLNPHWRLFPGSYLYHQWAGQFRDKRSGLEKRGTVVERTPWSNPYLIQEIGDAPKCSLASISSGAGRGQCGCRSLRPPQSEAYFRFAGCASGDVREGRQDRIAIR